MDPCVEVATLVVSYLWPLRELMPHAKTLAELETADGPSLEKLLHTAAGQDFALLARLRNVAHRRTNERWPAAKTESNWTTIKGVLGRESRWTTINAVLGREAESETLGQILKHEMTKRRDDSEQDGRRQSWLFRFWTERATWSDCQEVSKAALQTYTKHLRALMQHFPDTRLRTASSPGPAAFTFTREGLSETIALDMLQRNILKDVAEALEYRPILIRALDGDAALLADEQYPRKIIKRADKLRAAVPFAILMHRELGEIAALRSRRRGEKPSRGQAVAPSAPTLATRRAFDECLLGVALSGGGIRSATFSLGILQGLASRGWLRHIDYLSTVSGGGYIGSWLLAWIKRRGSVTAVEESLRGYYSQNGEGKGARTPTLPACTTPIRAQSTFGPSGSSGSTATILPRDSARSARTPGPWSPSGRATRR